MWTTGVSGGSSTSSHIAVTEQTVNQNVKIMAHALDPVSVDVHLVQQGTIARYSTVFQLVLMATAPDQTFALVILNGKVPYATFPLLIMTV